jgi:hypothetical protein
MRTFQKGAILLLLSFSLLLTGCGTAHATNREVTLSGRVGRECGGPVRATGPICNDAALLTRKGKRIELRGNFSVQVTPGYYKLIVDGCPEGEFNASHSRHNLILAFRGCVIPLQTTIESKKIATVLRFASNKNVTLVLE